MALITVPYAPRPNKLSLICCTGAPTFKISLRFGVFKINSFSLLLHVRK